MAGPLRYVVLRHEGIPIPHYDLMWETECNSPLATARCSEWPPREGVSLQRLADHRRLYLDYEGPVSQGRGHVRRVASGTCEFEAASSTLRLDNGLTLRVPEIGA